TDARTGSGKAGEDAVGGALGGELTAGDGVQERGHVARIVGGALHAAEEGGLNAGGDFGADDGAHALIPGAGIDEPTAMLVDGVDQGLDALSPKCAGADDGCFPSGMVASGGEGDLAKIAEIAGELGGFGTVPLGDNEHIADLERAGLEGLDAVTGARYLDEQRCHGEGRDGDLVLAGADGLDDDGIVAGGVEGLGEREGVLGEAAAKPARCHAPDEDAGVVVPLLHADTVTEGGAAGERAARVNRDDGDPCVALPVLTDHLVDERRFPATRWAGDADEVRLPGVREETVERLL